MENNSYERYAKIRDIKGLTDYKVANITGIGTPTISNWKNGKYTPKDDKIQKIANCLNINTEFLTGKTDMCSCPICGYSSINISKESEKQHHYFHESFLKIKEIYPFFIPYSEASKVKSDSIYSFRNTQKTIDERLAIFDKYLKSAFSMEIIENNYHVENLNYEDFCKVEVASIKQDWSISQELIDALIEKYGIDREYLSGNEQLLARVSKNDKLMKLLSYAEKLSPEMLSALEIQVKALAEQSKKE